MKTTTSDKISILLLKTFAVCVFSQFVKREIMQKYGPKIHLGEQINIFVVRNAPIHIFSPQVPDT